MRKLTLIIIIAMASFYSFGQYNYGRFNYYTAGASFSYDMYNYEFNSSQNVTHKQVMNYTINTSFGYYFTYLIEFHGGLQFSQRNLIMDWHYPVDSSDLFVPDETLYKLKYISIPLDARINALYGRYVKLSASVGIQPEFRLRPREIVTYQNDYTAENFLTYTTKDFRKAQFAFPLGLHLKVNFNRNFTAEISGRYLFYMNKINKVYSAKNHQALNLSVGFFYDW